MNLFAHMRVVKGCGLISILLLHAMLQVDIVHAASIKIIWNANQETDLSGYKVYVGTAHGTYAAPIDAGNITAHEIIGLNDGVRYYIAVSAYDTSHNESAKSEEISGIARSTATSTVIATTTLPSSTSTSITSSTSSVQPVTTSTVIAATTSIPITSTMPSSSTTSIAAGITTTTSIVETTASCDAPEKLQPLSVSASTAQHPFFPADNLIDGNTQTIWATLLTFFRRDASITLDLGSEKTITTLSMYASRMFGIDFLPAEVELLASSDNNTWQTISTAAVSSELESAHADVRQISGLQCRYLRLCINGRKALFPFQLAQIAELEVYGCDAPAHLPFAVHSSSSSDRAALPESIAVALQAVGTDDAVPPGVPGRPIVSFK